MYNRTSLLSWLKAPHQSNRFRQSIQLIRCASSQKQHASCAGRMTAERRWFPKVTSELQDNGLRHHKHENQREVTQCCLQMKIMVSLKMDDKCFVFVYNYLEGSVSVLVSRNSCSPCLFDFYSQTQGTAEVNFLSTPCLCLCDPPMFCNMHSE